MANELRESCAFENSSHRVDSNGKFIVAGQFSKADLRNENGRVYRRSMWENVLRRPYIIDSLKKRKMLGELGHPDKIETTPLNVSHIVTKLELLNDGQVYGEAEILDTPSGRVLKTLYEAGVEMGISSRGYLPEGSNLYAEGEDLIVPDDYELVTFDFVIDPSSQGACPKIQESAKKELSNILTESRDKLNADTISFIEQVTALNESETAEGNVLTESACQTETKLDDTLYSSEKEVQTSMEENTQVQAETTEVQEEVQEEVQVDESLNLYADRLEGVVGELRQRYLTAESVINDFVKERDEADRMLKGVTERYLTAEQAIEGLRDYSLKLEETVDGCVSLYRTSEAVIAKLRDQYKVSESVIKDLRDRYTLSESVIKDLTKSYQVAEQIVNMMRDRYTLSEACLKEFAKRYSIAEAALNEMVQRTYLSEAVILGLKDRLESARRANISLKKQLESKAVGKIDDTEVAITDTAEFDKLQEKCQLQEEIIASLTEQINQQKQLVEESKQVKVEEAPKRVPVPNSYFEDCAQKYGISIQECKNVFQALGCRKSAFEFHLNEMKRATRNNYSEFPYMVNNSTASQALTQRNKNSEVDRIARLVESAF